MKNFDILNGEIEDGLKGRNVGPPTGFQRLNKYMGIRKRMYFLIGGYTGSGKTTFLDECFILNPYDWYISDQNNTDIKLKIIYRSMERSRVYKLAKWTVRRIFIDHGIVIPMFKLLGWSRKKEYRLTHDEHDLVKSYRDYFNQMEDIITIIDGPDNPIGISTQIKEYALKNGKVEEIDKYNKVYIPNDENEITIVALDNVNLIRTIKGFSTKKAAIDKTSDELRHARDFYGYTPIAISQFNREISNPFRIKQGDVEPQLEDFKESGQTQDDSDVVLALFDPIRYKVADVSGYDLNRLKDTEGNNYFRSLRLLKNTYGAEDLRIGLAFLGEAGIFRELPRQKEIMDDDYERVLNRTYFLDK